mgnify:CR=1 FL=1
MNLEIKDELEYFSPNLDADYKNEISNIIKLFKFSNLNLLISKPEGQIVFGSNSFCNFSGFYIKELVRENLEGILNKKFDEQEIYAIEREPECFSAMRILKTRNKKEIRVNTYNTILREFLNTYIVTIVIPSPVM